MKRAERPILTIVVDTREKTESAAYWFKRPRRREFSALTEIRRKLDEGDYAAELGSELLPVRIERKAMGDLFMCCGYERERFERELERLRAYERAYLMIEATWAQVFHGFERSRIPGPTVLASIASWQDEFGISAQFAGNWANGRAWTQRLLEEAAARWLKKNGGAK